MKQKTRPKDFLKSYKMEEDEICLVCGFTCRMFTGSADLLAVLSHRNHAQYEMYLPIATRLVEIHSKSTFTNDTDVLKHLSTFPSPFLCANCCYYVTDFMTAESMVLDAKTVLEKRMQNTFESFSPAPKRAVPSDTGADAVSPAKKPRPTAYKTRKSFPPVPLFSEPSTAPLAASTTPANSQINAVQVAENHVQRTKRLKRKKVTPFLTCQVPSCGKIFKNSSNFFIHIAKFHRKEVARVCPVCGHVVGSKKELQRHLYAKHPSKRHVEWLCCFNCPAIFQDKALLCRHLQLFQHQAAPTRLSLAKLLANAPRRRSVPSPNTECRESALETQAEDENFPTVSENREINEESNDAVNDAEQNSNLPASELDLAFSKLQPVVKVQRLAMESLIATPEGGYVLNQAPPLPVKQATPPISDVAATDTICSNGVTSLVNELEEDDVFNNDEDDEEAELAALASDSELENAPPHGRLLKCIVGNCDAAFSSINYLNVHLIKRHKRIVRHLCPFCADIFDTGEEMDRHVLVSHTANNPYRYKCNDCAGLFRDKTKLWKHTQRLKHQATLDGVSNVSNETLPTGNRGVLEKRKLIESNASNGDILPFVADGLESVNQTTETLSMPCNGLEVLSGGERNAELDMSLSIKKRKELKERLISYIESRSLAPSAREDGDPLAVPSPNNLVNEVKVPNGTENVTVLENGNFKEADIEMEGLALAVSEMGKSVPSRVQLMHPVFVLKPVTLDGAQEDTLSNGFTELLAVNGHVADEHVQPTLASDGFRNDIVTTYYANGLQDISSSNVLQTCTEDTPQVASSNTPLPPPIGRVPVAKRRTTICRKLQERPSSRSSSRMGRASTPSFSEDDSDESYTSSVGEHRKHRMPMTVFPCPRCDQTRPHFNAFNTHILDKHKEIIHMCRHCQETFNTRQDFDDHVRQRHPETLKSGFRCLSCPGHYSSKADLIKHLVRYRHDNPDHFPSPQK